MKLAAMMTIAAMLAASAQAKFDTSRQVTVYLNDSVLVPYLTRVQAEELASRIFAGAGVKIHFREGAPSHPEPGAIVIEFAVDTPFTLKPGAFAYALPYEGIHIRIFWDRIRVASTRELLAYVMVHEITHILQGIAHHSDEGIMKANWSSQDEYAMKNGSLHFAPADVDMIYAGLDARNSHATTPGAPVTTIAASGAADSK